MASEPEHQKNPGDSGIPMKASKPSGASIRMTRSKESEHQEPNPPSNMSEEDSKTHEEKESAAPKRILKPKRPQKKAGGLPPIGGMKAKEPKAPLLPKETASSKADEAKDQKPAAPTPAAKTEEKSSAPDPKSEKVEEKAAEAPKKPAPPKLPPVGGKKPDGGSSGAPKLTPKIPQKKKPAEAESSAQNEESSKTELPKAEKPKAEAPKTPAPKAPEKAAEKPKAIPPKPHVVKPAASKKAPQPTQGGSAVSFESGKKQSAGVSPVGVAIDLVACIGALAVGYLIITDLLKFL